MKNLYFFLWCSIGLFGVCSLLTISAGGAEPTLSIDKTKIRAIVKDGIVEVSLPVSYDASQPTSYKLSVSVEDLKGKELGSSAMPVEISRSMKDIDMVVNAKVNVEQLPAYILHYTLSKDGETLEGKKSLFYAVRQIQTRVLMQRQFYANSLAAIRLIVTDPSAQQAINNASVEITLAEASLFQGVTDESGTLDAQFTLPDGLLGDQEMMVKVSIDDAQDIVRQNIHIQDVYKILLTTDKPLYQPGQIIHIRSLALKKPDLLPASEQDMTIEVEDSKGNKVFRKVQTTNEFGISSAEFQLAHELNEGPYTIRALFGGNNTQEKTVIVERYVLPKFNLVLETDQPYYQPGQTLKGELQVDYFFGKPVSGGTVVVTLSKFDTQFEKFVELKGKTDENGHYTFETDLPEHFVGQPLEQGNAFVKLDVSVVDTADHEEQKTLTRTIAAEPLHIAVIPESGTIVPGLENIFYVAASYPDGTPAEVSIKANFSHHKPFTVRTDASGIAEMRVVPKEQTLALSIVAKDKAGNSASPHFRFDADGMPEQILLRTDKALYRIGDTMQIDLFSGKSGETIYVDMIKDGQTFLTKAVDIKKGRGELEIEAAVSGSLQLHAYQILSSSDIIRDTKLLYVEAADALQIEVNTAKASYLPGEEAQIDFQVTNAQGHPVLAALGVNIVDESVFALQEMQPGLEKVYFMLEKEIMTPRYEIHAYSMEQVILDTPFLRDEPQQQQVVREKAAQVLLAAAENLVNYDVNVNTFAQKTQNMMPFIQEQVMEGFQKIYQGIHKYSKKRKQVLKKKEGLKAVIEAGFLKPEDLIDPWGNPYKVEPGNGDYSYLNFWCLGPDELEGTKDDMWFSAYIDLRSDKPGLFDWLLGRGVRLNKGKVDGDMMFYQAMPVAAAPMMLEEAGMTVEGADMTELGEVEKDGGSDAGPRIRQYFPETLYTNPAILTDEDGKASVSLTMADSITTWRMTSMASSLDGTLGSGTSSVKVFQDFFVDIDLPVTLTQNDQVSIPIAIYNYLPGTQDVRLKLTEEDWFELVDDIPEKTVSLNSGQVDVVYFTLKVKTLGWHTLTVHAFGSEKSDAIARRIEVLPDGKQVELTWNGRLNADMEQIVTIPQNAIAAASKILVKIYPGIFSQIVEGLDSILRMPSGCFEQTSSTTYPNVLVLDYMKQVNQITPEIQMKAESFINTGYQRLLSYEVSGGGFEWFGRAPAHKILTAYGLMEFYDMAQVHDVDPDVITRTQQWLMSQQERDGSWKPAQEYLDVVASKFADDVMRNTAYISGALLATGAQGDAVNKAIAYMKQHLQEVNDNYTLALVANALVLYEKDGEGTASLLETLIEKKQEEAGKIWWDADSTSTNAAGVSARIETSALVALALMNAEKHHETVSKILTYLIESKDAYGTWHSTQATILSMKALLLSMKNATGKTNAVVTVAIDDQTVEDFALTPENSDVMRLFDLKDQTKIGDNTVKITFGGEGSALYQIVGRFYLPWENKPAAETAPMDIQVNYDKTELSKDDTITASVVVTNNRPARTSMVIIDLGVPPGFEVQTNDLAGYVTKGVFSRFNLTGRQIIVYLDYVDQDKPVEFSYRLKAKFPVKAKTPKSTVYEYYNPDVNDEALPQEIVVSEK
ncbi:hypothetical protein CSA56_10500 [candidate division KSB3 bacterium]|uniref:Alpha-2-macroglobulin n=1 Tax=candidate division KSB3 bacterium TaxID=2044937 RepID=A0A2G6KDL7_9BACT|nr:MAG: hypothetical protein CSA56_10500 [candidate division KSB3 bacterium]